MSTTRETLADLLRRYCDDEDPPDVPRVSLADAIVTGEDPMRIVQYFSSLGIPLRTLEDLMLINNDQKEDSVHSFPVAEGVVVASDGSFQLFVL